MATYIKPQVLVYQEFQATPSATDTDLRAWIVGPNGVTHKRGEDSIGDYADVPRLGLETTFPGIEPGSLIDEDSVKVCVDDAVLQYAHVEPVEIATHGVLPDATCAYNYPGTPNKLVFNKFNLADYKTNQRDDALGNRDVQPGDTVILSAYAATIPGVTECEDVTFETKVLGLSVERTPSEIGDVVRKTNKNANSLTYTVTKSVGDGAASVYQEGTAAGYAGSMAEEVYTLTIVNATIDEVETKYYTVESASGTDSYPEIAPLPSAADSKFTFTVGRKGTTYAIPSSVGLPEGEKTVYTIKIVSGPYEPSAAEQQIRLNPDRPTEEIPGYGSESEDYDGIGFQITGTYDPKPTGWLRQKYEITAIARNSSNACKNIEFRIISESGLDDTYKAQAVVRSNVGEGNTYSFNINADLVATFTDTEFDAIEVGTTWLYQFTGPYNPTEVTVGEGSKYTGPDDDTYIITCVAGGVVGDPENVPKVIIHSRTGSEYLGPIEVTDYGALMSYGVSFKFREYQAAVAADAEADPPVAASPAVGGDMMLNDVWVVRVKSEKNGPVNGLILRDSIPEAMRTIGTDYVPLDVKFCIVQDVTLPGISIEGKKLTVPYGIKMEVEGITERNGAPKKLDLLSGEMTVAYREWAAKGSHCLNYIATLDEIDSIPGEIEPDNPLKYAVYKALANSNGRTIVYTPVLGDTLDDWNEAFDAGIGSREVYTLVPLSQDIHVLNLAATVINNDSNEETCAWKTGFFNITAPTSVMRVGKSDNILSETSIDGEKVFATITKDGIVEITSKYAGKANASLLDVKEGDELRVYGTGRDYVSYLIDSVDGDTMQVLGVKEAIDISTSIEVWHHLTRDEQVAYICDIAQSFSNRRIKLVWPDLVGEGGWELPGTFLCAALAGLTSGILPNQSLTRVSLSGFDDLSRSFGYFTDTQIKRLAASGVWCVVEDQDGTVYTMHGRTTDTLSIQYSEEMMTRIIDFISFRIRELLEMYIGTTNVTEKTLDEIRSNLALYLRTISELNYNAMGPLATEFNIISVEQDPLLLDRVNVAFDIKVVKCTNYVAVHIQAS